MISTHIQSRPLAEPLVDVSGGGGDVLLDGQRPGHQRTKVRHVLVQQEQLSTTTFLVHCEY